MEVIGRVESACSTVLTLRIKVGVGYDGIIEAELTFEVCCSELVSLRSYKRWLLKWLCGGE